LKEPAAVSLLINTGIRNRRASVDSRRVKRTVLFEALQLSPVMNVSKLRTKCGQGTSARKEPDARALLISTGKRKRRASADSRRVKRRAALSFFK